jgi:hypothetical protein
VLEEVEPPALHALGASPPALKLHPPVVPDWHAEERDAKGETHHEQEDHHPSGQPEHAAIIIGSIEIQHQQLTTVA